ncbi:NAD(P)-binding domain-containing protein [Mesorhizobium sp. M0136]|uniref:NADPH-dependent F420 reductase n=1 Tax=Mesorhizobium sp. M0136 TaxID=2956890 RepID=UPI00333CBD2F
MTYAIIGAGAVGQALAKMFARKGIEVAIASTRAPKALAPLATAIGTTVIPSSLNEAIKADIILLAVPFWAHGEVANTAKDWRGKIIIDVTNAYGVSPSDLGSLPSSAVVAKAFGAAALVKAFNHLPAGVLVQEPSIDGWRRVVFLSSDNDSALPVVSTLVEQLGYAPVNLGRLAEGGLLIQARGNTWAPLIFKDLFKKQA